jgi:multidrug efflux pump subunit AcrA (membrane-fusion protein)
VDVPRIRPKPRFRRIILIAGAVVVVAGVFVALRWLADRAPTVSRANLWIGTVQSGPLTLEARGTGTLVPVEIRWVSAPMSSRVERVPVQPGARVEADTIVVELSNPDAELAALDAERDVGAAEAELARLSATLDGSRLAQESAIAALESDMTTARRRSDVDQAMLDQGVISNLETAESADRARQLAGRVDFERRRLDALKRGNSAQLVAQKAQVDRLRELAEFRRRQLDALKVRAGIAGVVQATAVEVGQTVALGAPLAKVVVPDRLKARLAIAESSAADLAIGLRAVVDTRSGKVDGTVERIDPAATNGIVTVDVALPTELPKAARPDLNVDGVIELAKTGDVLYVARPAIGEARSTTTLFKLTGDGEAVRVTVKFGRAAVKDIEVVGGLVAGDRVVLSDMARWDGHDRLNVD